MLSFTAILFFAAFLLIRKKLGPAPKSLEQRPGAENLRVKIPHDNIPNGRSRKRGHSPYPVKVYTGRLPRGRKRGLEVEKMDVKE